MLCRHGFKTKFEKPFLKKIITKLNYLTNVGSSIKINFKIKAETLSKQSSLIIYEMTKRYFAPLHFQIPTLINSRSRNLPEVQLNI